MVEWKFARRQDRCSACGKDLEEGERHVSALSISGEDLARADVCLACWEGRGLRGELFFWYTRSRSGRRGLQLDLPMLEQLFQGLEGREEEALVELRYVLCLLLMRKRRLKLVRVSREPAGELLLVRRPRRDESIRVLVRELTPERMEETRRKLSEIFDGAEAPGAAAGSGEPAEETPPLAGVAS